MPAPCQPWTESHGAESRSPRAHELREFTLEGMELFPPGPVITKRASLGVTQPSPSSRTQGSIALVPFLSEGFAFHNKALPCSQQSPWCRSAIPRHRNQGSGLLPGTESPTWRWLSGSGLLILEELPESVCVSTVGKVAQLG